MANNIKVLDAVGATATVKTTDTAGVHNFHYNIDTVNAVAPAFGSGAVGATVQRVTIATDDTLTANASAMATSLALLDNALNGSAYNVVVSAGASDYTSGVTATPTGVVGIGGFVSSASPTAVTGTAKDFSLTLQGGLRVAQQGDEYETVAASVTAQALGATGGVGDYIAGILVIPATTSPGNVLLLDNATSITVFAGGASSVTTLHPFYIPLGLRSVSGAWKITTGANVSCIGIGDFT